MLQQWKLHYKCCWWWWWLQCVAIVIGSGNIVGVVIKLVTKASCLCSFVLSVFSLSLFLIHLSTVPAIVSVFSEVVWLSSFIITAVLTQIIVSVSVCVLQHIKLCVYFFFGLKTASAVIFSGILVNFAIVIILTA